VGCGLTVNQARAAAGRTHLATFAFQNREITRNSDKIWPYSSSRSSKVTDLGVNRKLIWDFLLVINSNFGLGHICYRFRDIDALNLEMVEFSHYALAWGSRSGNPSECRDEIWRQKTRGATRKKERRNHDEASFPRFDTIPACDRRTDRQTDRHVALAKSHASIAARG